MDLLRKYNVPGPRYTSYPTVPHWSGIQPSGKSWSGLIQERQYDSGEEGISLYIHLPFCEKMCAYCGCTTRITVNHEVESPYIELLLKEWEMYLDFLSPRTVIKELHLGGGTPTFFAPGQLKRLIDGISAGRPFADKA
jgi:oxygen-independent coproporphyrinogen-3 oxidase